MDGFVQAIKQYPGQQQVDRSVKVKVPGKHFPQLQASEQAAMYWGTAVEFRERQKFPRHAKAWGGGAHRARNPIHLRFRRHRRPGQQRLLHGQRWRSSVACAAALSGEASSSADAPAAPTATPTAAEA